MMSITLDQAQIIAQAALAKGRALSLKPLSVVVLDPRASMVTCLSEDGVSQLRAKIALGKASAAIQLGLGTRALMNRAEQQAYFIQAMNGLADGNFVPVPGGVLIRDKSGALLGAVGISGDTSDNDETAALAGIEAADLVADAG
ncbi:MAG: GlcG/HbpS family heme-binding protein [Candidatus Puniceispirillum sp.]